MSEALRTIVLFADVSDDDLPHVVGSDRIQQRHCLLVRQMAQVACNTSLQLRWIRSAPQHFTVVIGLHEQRITAPIDVAHVWCDVSDVGQHADADARAIEYELRRLAGVVWHRNGRYADTTNREIRMRVEWTYIDDVPADQSTPRSVRHIDR